MPDDVRITVDPSVVMVDVRVAFGPGRSARATLGLAGVVLLALSDAGDDHLVLVRSSFAAAVEFSG